MTTPDATQDTTAGDDLLWRHLKSVPAFRALLRAVEARFYYQLEIPEPVLDLGCGDGHFAGMAFDRRLTAGVDPWWGPLKKAQRAGVYRLSIQAMGDALPFADGAFRSVISNSVLEHIPAVQPVLDEAARVLRPGGLFVITVPSHHFTEYLGGASLLRPLGLADAYRRLFNRISRHAHTDAPEVWARRLTQAGFSVERWQYYFSREALRVLELGHVQGLPSAVLHLLTGHWILGPWPENLRLTDRWVRPYYLEAPAENGAYLLMVARKTQEVRQTEDQFEVRLPAPRPLPQHEPQPADGSQQASPSPSLQPMAEEPAESVFTYRTNEEDAQTTATGKEVSGAVRSLSAFLLLLAGVMAAFTGQSILGRRLPSSLAGLGWYAFALLAFAGGAALLRREELGRSVLSLSRRFLLYPLALVLAFLAQDQSSATLSGGSAALAFVLWLLAITLAYVAFAQAAALAEAEAEFAQDLPQRSATSYSVTAPAPGRTFAEPLIFVALLLVALLPRLVALSDHPFILNGIEASIGLDAVAVLRGQIRNPFATAWLTNPTLPLFPLALPIALFGRTILGIRILSALLGALTVPLLFVLARRLWNVAFAATAALLLAGYHLHVHYSRLGMTNIWDPLIGLLSFGLIALAIKNARRRNWLLAGMAAGLGAYFYTASHLLPFFMAAMLAYFAFVRRDILIRQWPHLLAFSCMALVVALPQILFYRANPGIYMERANALSILQNGWLLQQEAAGGSVQQALVEQLQRAFLAFNASLDTSTSYNPGIPLLRFWPSIFFVLGTAVAIWRLRQPRYAFLLIWLFTTLLFGGALLVEAPASHRLLIAAPAAVLLTATGLFWLGGKFQTALSALGFVASEPENDHVLQARLLALALVLLFFVSGDLIFYFGQYRLSHRFGDRNSEVAHVMGQYLQSLEGEWQVQFHGPPAMYVSFPTILYLADEFQPGQNLFDVTGDSLTPPTAPEGANLAFIYLPERSGEVNQTAERFPQGALHTFDGNLANPLFYVYEVRP